jgi:hypothetical protein
VKKKKKQRQHAELPFCGCEVSITGRRASSRVKRGLDGVRRFINRYRWQEW